MSLVDKLVDPFVKKWTEPAGQIINNGGVQCVAVFNQQENEIVGGGWIGTPITGYADDLWTQFGTDSDYANYVRIPADQPAQKGDTAIWYHYNGGNNLPHVALVLADLGDQLRCLTQNPGAAHIDDLTKKGIAGYLRPKKFINQVPAPTPAPQSSINTTHYGVRLSIPGYVNSHDASNRVNSNSHVPAGVYTIFSTAIGMINVTAHEGQPGWWINPGDNVEPVVPKPAPAPVQTPSVDTSNRKSGANSFIIGHIVPGYITANDAMAGVNSNSSVPVGSYSIFNEWNGAINVTRSAGQPGWWINPKT